VFLKHSYSDRAACGLRSSPFCTTADLSVNHYFSPYPGSLINTLYICL